MSDLNNSRPAQTCHSERSRPTFFLPRSLLRTRRPAQSRNLSSLPLLHSASRANLPSQCRLLNRFLFLTLEWLAVVLRLFGRARLHPPTPESFPRSGLLEN